MASIDELAKKYARRLRNLPHIYQADRIITEIENLSYSNTNTKISNEDKKRLLDLIHHYLNYPPSDTKLYQILEKSDNKEFLTLINYINSKLTGGN
ncbi:hypothetical protein [Peribacillus butanolivorans]